MSSLDRVLNHKSLNNIGLSNDYIDSLLKHFQIERYWGVFSADNFPLGGNGVIIVNTDPSHARGEHFIALLRKGKRRIFFDPFGLPLQTYPYVARRLKNEPKYKPFLKTAIQSPLSNFCGVFCVLFIILSDKKFKHIEKHLKPFETQSIEKNDEICVQNLEYLTKFYRNKYLSN